MQKESSCVCLLDQVLESWLGLNRRFFYTRLFLANLISIDKGSHNMTLNLEQIAREYHRALVGLLDAIPRISRGFVPPCISRTAFVIAVVDPRGRYAVEFLGRDRYETINLNGKELSPLSEKEPGFIVCEPMSRLESVVFPGTPQMTHQSRGD